MGLDNGIVVVMKRDARELPSKIETIWNYEEKDSVYTEIAYWRKCWGIRNELVDFFGMDSNEAGDAAITIDNIDDVIAIIEKFLDPTYWDWFAESIWTYEDYYENLMQNVTNMRYFKKYLMENPDTTVYFYDSW